MIRNVFIGANGDIGTFDEKNERIPEFCGKHDLVHQKLFEAIAAQKLFPGFMDQRVLKAMPPPRQGL